MKQINNLEILSKTIQETNQFFINRVQKQVNVAMTLRNWIIGCNIVHYEQSGEDKAKYGKKVLETLASKLKEKGLKGLHPRRLPTNYLGVVGRILPKTVRVLSG